MKNRARFFLTWRKSFLRRLQRDMPGLLTRIAYLHDHALAARGDDFRFSDKERRTA